MLNFYKAEKQAFNVFNSDAKKLITINVLYAFAFPFIIIFSAAFINRATSNTTLVILNAWGFYAGLVLGYLLNGLLLRRFEIKHLFALGMVLSVVSNLLMMLFVNGGSGYNVAIYGLFTGIGSGIYWSCRNFLSYLVTNEGNRNFFTGFEQFFNIFCNALIPFVFGTLVIGLGQNTGWYTENLAYQLTAGFMVFLILYAAFLTTKSTFQSPVIHRFIYFKFTRIWNVHRLATFCVGMVESGFMVLMTILILTLAGDEKILGKVEFLTAIVSVTSIYIVSRLSKPRHRGGIMLAGAISLIIGGTILIFTLNSTKMLFNCIAISFLGIIIMKISQVIADPMVHSSFRATYLSDVEKASSIEKRESYAYIMDNEYFMNGGRIFGGLVFLILDHYTSVFGALRFTFLILALIQLFTAYLIKKLNNIKIENTTSKAL